MLSLFNFCSHVAATFVHPSCERGSHELPRGNHHDRAQERLRRADLQREVGPGGARTALSFELLLGSPDSIDKGLFIREYYLKSGSKQAT